MSAKDTLRGWTAPSADEPVAAGGRVGFFTDTSVCIGCKACEVACKEWNLVPADGLTWTGDSYDNTSALGANTWRHVAFIEQRKPQRTPPATAVSDLGTDLVTECYLPAVGPAAEPPATEPDDENPLRWLMSSDVCKHCTHAACLDVCPTGALFRTEFETVVVQEDICNGCGYCVPACPFGVIDRRRTPAPDRPGPLAGLEDGRVHKCTLCYDRLKGGHEPACAKACPTDSIQFGNLDELRDRAAARLEKLEGEGWNGARLYGHDPDDGVGGFGAFFLLLDEPEVYGLPPDPVAVTRDLPALWRTTALAAGALVAGVAAAFLGGPAMTSYYGRPILKEPVWTPEVPAYFFAGGLAGASAVLSLAARAAGHDRLARTSLGVAFAGITVSPPLLISDLGRPERFLNMLRVFKVTSPMSVGSWVLAASGASITAAAGCEALGVLPRTKVAAATVAGVLGPVLATYTGTLLANTAIPVWQEARRELPFVFGASAAASAGAAAALLLPAAEAGPARRLAIGAAAVELAGTELMTRRLGFLAEPYRTGSAARLARAAKAATLTGAALLAARRHRLGGALVLAGSAALRFAVVEAGKESARDPAHTVIPQRARLG